MRSVKKVAFGVKPQERGKVVSPEEWVAGKPIEEADLETETKPELIMKRLTIDVPENLHTRIKVQCASRGLKIADEVRRLLEAHFPDLNPID